MSENQEPHQPSAETTPAPATETPAEPPKSAPLLDTGKQMIAGLAGKVKELTSSGTVGGNTAGLQENVKREFGTAWQFTKERVFPAVLNGVSWLVEKLDPPMAQVGNKIAQTVQANPNWVKLTESNLAKQFSTVFLSVTRSLGEVISKATANITLSDQVKQILSKKSALTTLLIVFLLILLLKPSPAPKVAKAPTTKTPSATTANAPKGIVPVAVQKQVLAIAQTYGTDLVQNIDSNSQIGRLVLELSDSWYQLTANQQDQLANELLSAGQKLRYATVVLADQTNHLLARPATVGKSMVILRR